jgi:hypothetical protein
MVSRSIGVMVVAVALTVSPAMSANAAPVNSQTAAPTASQNASAASSPIHAGARPLLPASFAGWTEAAAPAKEKTAGTAANGSAEVLGEYGFQRQEQARYTHGGEAVAVRAMKFVDATGAYGAFTYLRQIQMGQEPVRPVLVGAGVLMGVVIPAGKKEVLPKTSEAALNGAQAGGQVLFWVGDLLVEAEFDRAQPQELAALNTLARQLPKRGGPEGIPPSLPQYLPAAGLDATSVRYAIGPLGYAGGGGVLPAGLIHFDQEAEAVTARYGAGTLTLLLYPTPQLADSRVGAIDSLLKSGAIAGAKDALLVKRAGPLLAVTSGGFSPTAAKALLEQVSFHDYITIDHPQGYVSEVAKTAKLLFGIATLTLILGGAAVLLGLFLGGGRAAYRVMRGKPISSLNDEEFIRLKIEE